jgi:hypothetical protein
VDRTAEAAVQGTIYGFVGAEHLRPRGIKDKPQPKPDQESGDA